MSPLWFPKIGVFYKISLVILFFTAITYFLSTTFEDNQYGEQAMLQDYQDVTLYQMMANSWVNNVDGSQKFYGLDTLAIISDLEIMHLSGYAGIYNDINKNNLFDIDIDTLVRAWGYKQDVKSFDNLNYISYGHKDFIIDTLNLDIVSEMPYASYGVYGSNEVPAYFLEFPISDNKIVAYWLIMDYELPTDIYWPSVILPIAIVLILGIVFWIISSFLYPIKLMVSHVSALKKGSLDKQLEISASDELGVLATSINQMTADINLLINQKDELLLDVSHELKTPLTRLKFILANMNIEDANKEQLNKEINALKDMISNMLLSDKLSTPYIEDLNQENIEINDIIQDTCAMFYKIEEKMVIKNKTVPQTVYVDKYRICLALKNLIDNALKYTDSQKLIKLIIFEDKRFMYLEVQDFGKGIHAEQIKEIIKPLYRGRAAKEKNKSGFGLGLAIAKKIIEAHGGKLNIQSIIGEGSNFTLLIPKEGNEKHK